MNLDITFVEEALHQYKVHLERVELSKPDLKPQLLELIQSKEYVQRLAIWNKVVPNLNKKDSELISNPYFIGYGNPNADTIIFGMENAIDLNPTKNIETHNRLFFEENINNNYQWKDILQNGITPEENIERFPYPYYCPIISSIYNPIRKSLTAGHTWGIYAKFLSALNHNRIQEWSSYHLSENYSSSFSRQIFQSEINHIPSKKIHGGGLSSTRGDFLKNEFFRSFKNTIIAGRSYFAKNGIINIESLFDVSHVTSGFLDVSSIGNNRLAFELFTSKDRKVVLVNQMSGSAGWSEKGLLNLGKLLRGEKISTLLNSSINLSLEKQSNNITYTMKPDNQSAIQNGRFKNNHSFITFVTKEVRSKIDSLSLQNKIRVVQCGETRGGRYCWVYLRPIDMPDPNTQIIPNGRDHEQNSTSLLEDVDQILSEIEFKIQVQADKMNLNLNKPDLL